MKFKVNDTVMYSSHGIFKVSGITKKEFDGDVVEYYELKSISESSNFFIPVNNDDLTGKMRKILSLDEINALIKSMPDEKPYWVDDEAKRKEKYADIISKGDHAELISLIKAVYEYGERRKLEKKKLPMSDERFLKEAEELLYSELAHVLKIKRDQIIPFILNKMDDAPSNEVK